MELALAYSSEAERLGRYEILRPLAIGGMAELHLARVRGPERFEKLVVIKRILPQHARDAERVAMFLDEARLAARLHHSNIVQVFDIGVVDGEYFFAMEFLHGVDASALMKRAGERRRRALPLEHAVRIVLDVCAGLHYAHEKTGTAGIPLGIVHRDVSPHNVVVTFDGSVKLVDFGVAKTAHNTSETFVGGLKGKIRYMSPEQARGQPVDRRCDVFSLGILLWELTTGRRLFQGPSTREILRMIAEENPPPPSLVTRHYPAQLEDIVMRALQRRPEDRYQTAQELQFALEAFAREYELGMSSVALGRFASELFAERVMPSAESRREDVATTRPLRKFRAPVIIVEPPAEERSTSTPRLRQRSAIAVAIVLLAASITVFGQVALGRNAPPRPHVPPVVQTRVPAGLPIVEPLTATPTRVTHPPVPQKRRNKRVTF